ncbi:hypothetical protein EPUS_06278 [Endocarpon pusillum Z07020]|uniref:C2H2-type domain-containing protein n=1 Tax=Endocarpon pusillum (strain Z07020 / HMAS-L-300199) TaxID=1263415 RepID=U1I1C7_ENDPU|nr:uncharacterized protein EPUS_06278 [Endocarpon pusillum Z07020]ERF77060.1 hypothetical protein EPUS_06278 [Endocarpon pusillum Z07020]
MYYDYDYDSDYDYDYECEVCDRSFSSQRALNDHRMYAAVHRGRWCKRCELQFDSRAELDSHKAVSFNHSVCAVCQVDCESGYELDEHMNEEHFQCKGCLKWAPSASDLSTHMEKAHYYCAQCERFFENENNLRQHRKVHAPLIMECYGCERRFATTSAMLIHLESGKCDSGVNCDRLDSIAYRCYQSRYYTNGWNEYYQYKCPDCQTKFRYISALFQHAESDACNQRCNGTSLEKLRHYISISV